jgi:hypothetical protein
MENGIVWWCSCWWEGVTATIQRRHCDSDSYLHARTRGFTVSSMLKNARPSKEGFSCFSFWKAFHFRHHLFTSRKHPTTSPSATLQISLAEMHAALASVAWYKSSEATSTTQSSGCPRVVLPG